VSHRCCGARRCRRKFTSKLLEKQKGRFSFKPSTKSKVCGYIDTYFDKFPVFIRNSKSPSAAASGSRVGDDNAELGGGGAGDGGDDDDDDDHVGGGGGGSGGGGDSGSGSGGSDGEDDTPHDGGGAAEGRHRANKSSRNADKDFAMLFGNDDSDDD
jgi:hypothetical protein